MNFAVGNEVTIQSRKGSMWHGLKAKVVHVDSEDTMYPYDVLLLEDSPNKNFVAGDTVPAFREDELVPTAEVSQSDLEQAKALLERHGFAFRIYGREDVESKLDELASETDTRTFRSEIVEHVMNGQDWADLSNKEYDDDTTLWGIIMGTANDHPEWFIG